MMLNPFLKLEKCDAYIFVKSKYIFLSYWCKMLMVMDYGDPLSVDSWSKNIVLSNEFVDSCSITQIECLD